MGARKKTRIRDPSDGSGNSGKTSLYDAVQIVITLDLFKFEAFCETLAEKFPRVSSSAPKLPLSHSCDARSVAVLELNLKLFKKFHQTIVYSRKPVEITQFVSLVDMIEAKINSILTRCLTDSILEKEENSSSGKSQYRTAVHFAAFCHSDTENNPIENVVFSS